MMAPGEEQFISRLRRAEAATADLEQRAEGELGRACAWLRQHAREAFRVRDSMKVAECNTVLEKVEIRDRVARERLDYGPREPL